MTSVRTYADNGSGGLRLEGRDPLKKLLADVLAGGVPFKLILIFGRSRWVALSCRLAEVVKPVIGLLVMPGNLLACRVHYLHKL
jgi:hypothetical protein